MSCQCICPLYGQGIDQCDVGAGYISPHHVEVIVRYCISRYEDCANYKILSEQRILGNRRLRDDGGEAVLSNDVGQVGLTSGGFLFPLQCDPDVFTILNHEIRTPLTSIRSFTEILLNYPVEDAETRRRFLQIIQEEAAHLGRAMDRLFTTDAGAMTPDSSSGSARYYAEAAQTTLRPGIKQLA